ncbi:MAG: HlyD family efflux transporter periplasmic adaptor subunit [Bacteroidales bacterium]|nr:HlyD family efflux transporter periplasmic adaptor subunit [Bacteroidales bacterium]
MNKLFIIFISLLTIFTLDSCKEQNEEQQVSAIKTKVKVSKIEYGYIPDYIQLTGKTVYLNKSNLTAPINGYITKVNAQQGDIVKKGEVLFEMKTPEAYLMQNADSLPKTDYGKIKIYATVNGRIMNLSITNKNVFVDKGSLMCILMSSNDLKLQVNIPFEYNNLAKTGTECKIILPDNTEITGHISKYLPQVDEASQTVKLLANIKTKQFLPENMIVKVLLDKSTKHKAQILTKKCLQTDALMKKFWLMKLINDSTAVQIEVETGNQNHEKVEILSPEFSLDDEFISEGAYGLTDTVLIEKN